ncbi:MAG: acyltransferase [Beijerinckiaceae bacterium]|nr:acyltransferase [Beijerinckiaceae bacterium]
MLIGKGVSAMNGVHLDARFPWLLEIGRDTGLSVGVMVLTHDSSTRRQTGYTRIARVKIGERVYIGAHAIVLPGTTIGDDVIVAAGAIVRGEIPAGAVVAGVPARQVGTTEEYTRVHMEGIENGPAWSVDDWPFSGAVPIEKQRAMLDALGDGVGYVGRPLRPTSKVAAPGDS